MTLPLIPRSLVCVATAVVALLPTAALAANIFSRPNHTEIIVVVDFTAQGRKITPPTREQPAFYFPILAGYRAEGDTTGGEKQPPPKLAAELLAKALAGQNYLVTGPNTGRPSLVLVFHWGYMNPEFMNIPVMTRDSREPTELPDDVRVLMNEKAMHGLVLGNSITREGLEVDIEREELVHAVHQNRYFVTVSAYDFASAKKKNYVLLWQAKMSMPSNRVSLEQVLPGLIATGAPHFGRETKRPQRITAPVRAGNVEVGPLIVVPDTPSESKSGPEKK